VHKGRTPFFNTGGMRWWKNHVLVSKSLLWWGGWVMKGEKTEQMFAKQMFYFLVFVHNKQKRGLIQLRIVPCRG
jgi:hypothetical protein